MFTLFDYIIFVLVIVSLVTFLVWGIMEHWGRKYTIITLVVELVLIVAMVGGCAAYRTGTESGKRGLKTWQSETSGGIDRTVTVYDIQGKEIARYSGRFDVEESSQEGVVKIKFDCNGKRHIIYAQTGTVLIDETGEEEDGH